MKKFWGAVHIWPEYKLTEKARFWATLSRSAQLSRIMELTPVFSVNTVLSFSPSMYSPKAEPPV